MQVTNIAASPSFGASAASMFRDVKLRLPYVDTNTSFVGIAASPSVVAGQLLTSDIARIFAGSGTPDLALSSLCFPPLSGTAAYAQLVAPQWIALETVPVSALAGVSGATVLVQGAGRCGAKIRKIVAGAGTIAAGVFGYNLAAATNVQRYMGVQTAAGMASLALGQRKLALTLGTGTVAAGSVTVDDTEANAGVSAALVEVLFDGMAVIG